MKSVDLDTEQGCRTVVGQVDELLSNEAMVTTKPQEQESLRSASDFELTPSDAVEYPHMVHLGSDPLAEAKAALAPC